ncbi:unnamed protein product [Staurois parvus]|uniref:Uncharacterized protein n=1 Tax=Staurois parvus TaxID=386267 RepID=A0ABN9EW40_9NEOB|nr:unnamed protein product [Staurois parvus]
MLMHAPSSGMEVAMATGTDLALRMSAYKLALPNVSFVWPTRKRCQIQFCGTLTKSMLCVSFVACVMKLELSAGEKQNAILILFPKVILFQ